MWHDTDSCLWWVDFQTDYGVATRLIGINPLQRIEKPRLSIGFRGFPKNRERTLTVVCNSNRANCEGSGLTEHLAA